MIKGSKETSNKKSSFETGAYPIRFEIYTPKTIDTG